MALTNRNARASTLGLILPFLRVLPAPDVGAETQLDRQQVGFGYAGIEADEPAAVSADPYELQRNYQYILDGEV